MNNDLSCDGGENGEESINWF